MTAGLAVYCTDCLERSNSANSRDGIQALIHGQHRFLCGNCTANYVSREVATKHVATTQPPRPPEWVKR